MSTLRTFNLQNPDSGTVNIEMDQGGNTLMTGIATVRGAAHFTSTSGSDAVGIGTDITAYKLDVRVTGAEAGLRVYNPDTSSNASGILRLGNDDNQNAAFLRLNGANNTSAVGGAGSLVLGHGLSKDLHLSTAGVSRLKITSSGQTQITGGSTPFKVTHTGGDCAQFHRGSKYLGINADWGGNTGDSVVTVSTNLVVHTNGSNERLRIDSSGHLLHGVTADEDTSGNGGVRFINSGDIQIDGDQKALVFRSTNNTAQLQSAIEWWNENGAGVQSKIACDRTAVSQAPSDLVFYTSPNVDTGGSSSDGDITERLRIKSNGDVHIGNPVELANVATTTHTFALSRNSDNTFPCPGSVAISGATAYNTANYAGGGLRFLGKYTSAGQYTTFAHVGGIKENTTDGNYAGALTFHTRNHGGLGGERLRITSGGHLVVGSGYADFQSGTRGEASSTDPYKLVFQNQYSNGHTDEKLKLYLFNSGNTRQGFGPGPNYDLQYHSSGVAADQAKHRFYTDNVLRMEINDAHGGVTKPTQPGFFARRSVGGDNRAASAQEWTIAGTSSFNIGGHFNTSNGRFTAPVAGRYLFTAQPGYKQTSNDYNFKFLVNGGQQSEPVRIIDGGDDLTSHSGFTGTVIYNLNANDYVQVEVGYIHHANLTYNFFMGYLLG